MIRLLLFILFLFPFCLHALEVDILGAKEKYERYSTLHVKDDERFVCEEFKSDFGIVKEIVCVFSKQPQDKINPIKNDFFIINTKNKNQNFFLIIKPKYKIRLFPIAFDLTKEDTVFNANIKSSKHWMIVGYKNKLPYLKLKKYTDISINFPFYIQDDMNPYVGGLDIKGNPVYIKQVQDVSAYVKIKKLFTSGHYEQCLELIEATIQQHPNTLFMAELLYYKIKTYIKLKGYDSAIESAKIYLKNYSSDENIAEVVSLIAYSYYKTGLSVDADYFFDRLFSEHASSKAAQWGYIYKGEMLEESGVSSKAVQLYKKALDETKDIALASIAAYKLAHYYVNTSEYKQASKYIMKIVNANLDFFGNNFVSTMDMMYVFAQNKHYATAAFLANALLKNIDKNHDEYENLLKNKALWLCKTQNKQQALQALNEYLNKFKYGDFVDDIEVAKDKLFFDVADGNITQKLRRYDELMSKYKDDTIGDKALYEKAKLLTKLGKYSNVLKLKSSLVKLDRDKYQDIDKIIQQNAIGVMQNALRLGECKDVVSVSNEYNITLSSKWDDGLYKCFMKGAEFVSAKKIAKKYLQSKNLNTREQWLYRYIQIDFATGNYSDVLEASKELVKLIETDLKSPYKNIYRIIFDTYERLEKKYDMIDAMSKIEEIFGLDYKDIDRYASMVAVGNDFKDDNLVIKYATELRDIQISSSSYPQSPFVDFALYQAYMNKHEYYKALDVIKFLDKLKLTKRQRSRQKYLLGLVYEKLWMEDKARKSYEASIEIDSNSPWAKLAQDAKKF